MKFFTSQKKGFSLIQLLVVLAILGLLTSVVLANMQQVRMKARDAQRISDIDNIQLALRLYKDANGTYPDCDSGMMLGEGATTPSGCINNVDTALAPYMTKVPADPLTSSGTAYKYWYDSDYICIIATGIHNTILFVKTAELSGNQGKWKGKGTNCTILPMGQVTAHSYGIILK